MYIYIAPAFLGTTLFICLLHCFLLSDDLFGILCPPLSPDVRSSEEDNQLFLWIPLRWTSHCMWNIGESQTLE